jgi:hypothetical protein
MYPQKVSRYQYREGRYQCLLSGSVPDPGGSVFKSPEWLQICFRNPDPESEIEQ